MPKNRGWFVPFLFPLALGACSAPVDGSPFRDGTPATSDAPAAAPATNQTPASSPPASPPAAPLTPAGGETEPSAELPITPAPEQPNGADPPDDPPAPAPEPEPEPAPGVDVTACASYETGFLPLIHEPVCSRCHTSGRGLPQFEPFAQAEGRCAQIGRLVAAGEMPPGGGLSAEQRAIVASWVSLDCPETAADAAAVCAPSGTPAPDPAPTPPAGGGGGDEDDDDDDDGEEDEDDDDDDEEDD